MNKIKYLLLLVFGFLALSVSAQTKNVVSPAPDCDAIRANLFGLEENLEYRTEIESPVYYYEVRQRVGFPFVPPLASFDAFEFFDWIDLQADYDFDWWIVGQVMAPMNNKRVWIYRGPIRDEVFIVAECGGVEFGLYTTGLNT